MEPSSKYLKYEKINQVYELQDGDDDVYHIEKASYYFIKQVEEAPDWFHGTSRETQSWKVRE